MPTRWLIFHVASGQAFFAGAGCVIAAVGLSAYASRRGLRTVRNGLAAVGVVLAVASATPLATWFAVVMGVVTSAWAVVEALGGRTPSRVIGLRLAVVLLWLGAAGGEARHHARPALPRIHRPILGVVGDSLTAGTGEARVVGWPEILAREHGVSVRVHARAGAGVATARELAREVAADENLVLLEIGGNDLLGGTPVDRFEVELDRLLAALARPGRVVVLMELPLPPTFHAFGRVQRSLARRHGAILIPKRMLLGVLLRPGATSDTVHLTPEGARAMADAVWGIVRPAFVR
ncbi:GDSL-type esterase/lipase family protein [Paludisphaera soli]|uniref:GDSL-type esterase/lipase family protein n=1 Tax=Paludisphaera soli TaxID=2712865 RepID=UPI0013EB7925|nr:GDSL-type esterase/lipase family protein [Paludisphaera soli]